MIFDYHYNYYYTEATHNIQRSRHVTWQQHLAGQPYLRVSGRAHLADAPTFMNTTREMKGKC